MLRKPSDSTTPPVRTAARVAAVAVGALALGGTLLSFRRSPRWWFRVWDFPRIQIATAAGAAAALYATSLRVRRKRDLAFLGAMGVTVAAQARQILVYTPLWPVQVQRSRGGAAGNRLRILISNVERENDRYEALLERVREEDPDLVLAVEVDGHWARALAPLRETYPFVVDQAQPNHYGMMLFSRLELREPRVEFLVQDDIPSIHTGVVLPGGEVVELHGVHPRPPEPIRDQDAAPRDAELVIVGRSIQRTAADRPTLVAGDLNDVAWSHTTKLFLRLSGLLDPRIGRGFFNSFHAGNPLLRWPLDHIFHSSHFRVVEVRRLRSIGSDHFPMLAELSLEPDAEQLQREPEPEPGDEREADERLREQRDAGDEGHQQFDPDD